QMSSHHKDTPLFNEKKEKRKARYCDLEGQDDVTCDYEQYSAFITDSKCKKKAKTNANVCSHPKHEFYLSTAQYGMEGKKFKKAPKRLIRFFELA
ncbi:6526_t:CDS:2, partial [Funneliformis geosporum]